MYHMFSQIKHRSISIHPALSDQALHQKYGYSLENMQHSIGVHTLPEPEACL